MAFKDAVKIPIQDLDMDGVERVKVLVEGKEYGLTSDVYELYYFIPTQDQDDQKSAKNLIEGIAEAKSDDVDFIKIFAINATFELVKVSRLGNILTIELDLVDVED